MNKLIEVGFICEVKYPTWIANIVLVRKKNGQMDFQDLNDACPKDDFPLPITELMMDSALDIIKFKLVPEDQEAVAFRTPEGIFCYTVMSFGLKNAGANIPKADVNYL